jgi:hypothetical protein
MTKAFKKQQMHADMFGLQLADHHTKQRTT